jgi:hypothetical protein
MSKPAITLGAWQPDRSAPLLLDGQPIGKIVQSFGWYDLKFDTGLLWAGGKTLSKALATAAFVYRTRPDARAN